MSIKEALKMILKKDQNRLGREKKIPLVYFIQVSVAVYFHWHIQSSVEIYITVHNGSSVNRNTSGRCQEWEEDGWVNGQSAYKALVDFHGPRWHLDNKNQTSPPADLWRWAGLMPEVEGLTESQVYSLEQMIHCSEWGQPQKNHKHSHSLILQLESLPYKPVETLQG